MAGEEIESGGAIYRVNTESRLPTEFFVRWKLTAGIERARCEREKVVSSRALVVGEFEIGE